MKFFVDTADIAEVRELAETGLIDGVTTNPSLIKKAGRPIKEVIVEIAEAVVGPVSAEVAAIDTDGMVREGEVLADLADNVVVKVPLTMDGLKAVRRLSDADIDTNVTLCFSANQALLAAKAGATFISPFIGRLDDIGIDGMQLIRDIREIYDAFDFDTEILAASIRGPQHVKVAALSGADIATIPPQVVHQLVRHPLTEAGLAQFVADWKATGQSIL